MQNYELSNLSDGIAIVGMDGRFPGADSVDQFWQNICDGVESITFFTENDLADAGVPLSTHRDPNYVAAGAVLSNIEDFDAPFFGISPREAKAMDPQHRLLLECAWGGLENAGYTSETYDGRIGVYTGTSLSTYLHHNLLSNPDFLQLAGDLQIEIGNDKDFVPTRISYKMNLTGPSVCINTACSTSLVAVHLACQGLLDQECDMAIAGGATVQVPHGQGYWHQPGGIASADGHCRPFDAQAQGTVFGSGVGVVVLKRLEDALADRDHIYAVIRGSAINNDGSLKVGYTAPSVAGQADAIAEAQAIADIPTETITYIEAHGTGTTMGDPMEIAALSQAFRASTDQTGFCAIGSVKGNIGHLNRAAGVIGLIKTTLALKHQQLPPSLHFEQPNPQIEFDRSPFYVNTELQPWQPHNIPRRAGVSSFGIGGTNAHAILEEAPTPHPSEPASRPHQLLLLSAQTATALETATQNLAQHLREQSDLEMADVAYTLQVGRQAFNHRRSLVCHTREQAIAVLETPQSADVFTGQTAAKSQSITFMFSGQGNQYVNMARDLYHHEPIFRQQVDHCAQLLQPHLNQDLRQLIYPNVEQGETAAQQLQQTAITQPALFVIEYALAQLWMAWEVKPQAMIGHSIGEYVAACLAGVFSLEDALALVAMRGQMMQSVPPGAMLAIFLPPHEISALLSPDITLAASNSAKVSAVSGSFAAIDALEHRLQTQEISYRRLHTSHAFHSRMMEPMLGDFIDRVSQVQLNPPQIPLVSNVTGTWMTAAEATSPDYWGQHLCQTVLFAEGIDLLLQDPDRILLEVGPGKSLRSLAQQNPAAAGRTILSSVRHPKEDISDVAFLLQTLGQLWLVGYNVNWTELYPPNSRCRLPLPTYPFERQRYWVDPQPHPSQPVNSEEQIANLLGQSDQFSDDEKDLLQKLLANLNPSQSTANSGVNSDWFYQQEWQLKPYQTEENQPVPGRWLIFADKGGMGQKLATQLAQCQQECQLVYAMDAEPGAEAITNAPVWQINPEDPSQFEQLFQQVLSAVDAPPLKGIIHLWSLDTPPTQDLTTSDLEQAQLLGIGSVLHLVQALGQPLETPRQQVPKLWLVTQNTMPVSQSQSTMAVAQAPLWGLGKVIALEQASLWGGLIDLGDTLPNLATEILHPDGEDQVAFRDHQRYVARLVKAPKVEPVKPAALECCEDGTYLITGGLGSLGLQVAEWLTVKGARHLVLVGRRPPSEEARGAIATFQQAGIKVEVTQADIADFDALAPIFTTIQTAMPPLKGIIHLAGISDYQNIAAIPWSTVASVCSAKVSGTWNLHQLSQTHPLDFFVCFSSIASVWGGKGQSAYAAANQFLDAITHFRQTLGQPALTVNWGPWENSKMASADIQAKLKRMGIEPLPSASALRALDALLASAAPQVTVAQIDWPVFTALYETNGPRYFLRAMADNQPQPTPPPAGSIQSSLPTLPIDHSHEQLLSYLQKQVARTLGMGVEQIAPHQPLNYLGLDSLMAIELRNLIKRQCQVDISTANLMAGLSIDSLATQIYESRQTHSSAKLAAAEIQSSPQSSQSEQTYPLSYGQQALWLLYQQNSSNSSYNVSIPARIVSNLDVAALKQALQGLVDRHATLRTTFTTYSDGSPLQVVHDSLPVCFEHIYTANWSSNELNQAVYDTHHRPFDLAQGPIFRGTVFTRSPQEHVLLLSLHHIVYDAWSIGPLLNDLQQLYTAITANSSPKLSPNVQQYSDYVQWQTQMLAGPEGERLWDYWKNQLAGELPVLDLPTDRPYPKQPSYQGASHRFKLTPTQTQALKALAQSAGTTTYTVLMAAFQVFLHRYTGQTDILVGTPVGGRPQTEFEQMVGYFVNPVAIRGRLTNDLTFSDFLEQIRTTVLEALEHHTYPFPRLVERLQSQRDISRSSVFQVVFNFLQLQKIDPVAALLIADDDPIRLQWADLELESFPLEQQAGQFDLTLGMVETQTHLIGTLKYSTDLFNANTIERMASHFQMLLDSIVANPNQSISMLPLLTTDEQHQQLQAWNDTQVDYPQDKCIHQLFEEQVEKTPQNVAAIFQNRQLTYEEVNQKANQLAKTLQSQGIGRGTYVPVLIDRGVDLLIAHLAIMKTGAAFCPMDPKWPLPRIKEIISALNSNLVLVDAACPHQSDLSEKICLEVNETNLKGTQDNLDISVELDDPIYVIFTSGSTGKPKGAINQHRGIVNRFFNMNDRYGCREDDVILFTSSHVFDSSVWQLFWPLINGSPTVITPPGFGFDLERIIRLIHEQKVTISDFVPSVFNILVDHLSQHKEDRQKLGSLRQLLIGGEAMNANDIYQFKSFLPTIGITNTYGPTETSIGVVFYEVPPTFTNPIPIGRPLNNVYALILDRHLNPVPMGVTGELYIGGQCVGLGYLNDPVKTDAVFVDNPFDEVDSQKLYKTGDLVRYRPDGNIEFLGRTDHQVKIRGVRIELKEIESLLVQHPGVKRTIVIPKGDIKNKYLISYIITDEDYSVTAKELRNYLKQKLPIYMMPAGFVFLEMFPLTPNGKIDRRALPEPESTQLILDNTFIAPRNPTEERLSQIWGDLLNVNRIGIHDNFFELGGHSLLATQVISRLRSHFSIDIPLRSLFDSPTVAELAEDIELLHKIKQNSVPQGGIEDWEEIDL